MCTTLRRPGSSLLQYFCGAFSVLFAILFCLSKTKVSIIFRGGVVGHSPRNQVQAGSALARLKTTDSSVLPVEWRRATPVFHTSRANQIYSTGCVMFPCLFPANTRLGSRAQSQNSFCLLHSPPLCSPFGVLKKSTRVTNTCSTCMQNCTPPLHGMPPCTTIENGHKRPGGTVTWSGPSPNVAEPVNKLEKKRGWRFLWSSGSLNRAAWVMDGSRAL